MNFIYPFKFYKQKNVSWLHLRWDTLYTAANRGLPTEAVGRIVLIKLIYIYAVNHVLGYH